MAALKKKQKTRFRCEACGHETPRWLGKCPECNAWNTLAEAAAPKRAGDSLRTRQKPVKIRDVRLDSAPRLNTGLAELDRVLGGGIVLGSVVLLGGDPGIGKSTLMMQALAQLSQAGKRGLYVTAEESAAQVAMRARRLGVGGDVEVLATTDLSEVLSALAANEYQVLVLDSIQTVRSRELAASAGAISQLREVTDRLVDVAKTLGTAMFLVGHVTKDGALAGPKVLEHLVDAVLSFESDSSGAYRLIRTTKNRFGATHELGVFEMTAQGLVEVANPSALFLQDRAEEVSGSVVVPIAEGSRPLLVEVQALVAPTAYGSARRVASGVDTNRLAILLAVLERKAGLHVLERDVFVSVAGGARVLERASDLGVALAIASSFLDRPVISGLAAFGEVGLAGEVRAVSSPGARAREAKKLGFKILLMASENASNLERGDKAGLKIVPVRSLEQALEFAL